jgi:hypothetical protein
MRVPIVCVALALSSMTCGRCQAQNGLPREVCLSLHFVELAGSCEFVKVQFLLTTARQFSGQGNRTAWVWPFDSRRSKAEGLDG